MQEPDVYSYFTKTFNKLGVRYVVTGAVATIIYGVPRLTHDIDMVVELKKVDIDNIIKGFDESEFYCPPREIIGIEIGRTERGHFNIIHKTTAYKADIYLVGNDKLCMWALDNYVEHTYEGDFIRVAPPEYVIVRKLEYYREGGSQKHIIDIRSILEMSSELVDFKKLEELINELALQKEWDIAKRIS
jgi:hypothetical protein